MMDPNEHKPDEMPETQPETLKEEASLADAVMEGVKAAGGEVTDEPEAIPENPEAPEGETPEKPEENPEAAPEAKPDDEGKPKKEPERDEAVEKEIAELKLKDRAAERFRALTEQLKDVAPIREALDKAGIKDVAELPTVLQRASERDELIGMVADTGATPQQYGDTLDYLRLITAANNGDLEAAAQAYEVISQEQAALAKLLGREVPGVHDPLAEHQDLRDAVEAGDMDRKYALEVAQARHRDATGRRVAERRHNEDAATQAAEQGKAAIMQWDQQMLANDPGYAAKRPALDRMAAFIRQSLPPQQWLPAIQQAYATLPDAPKPEAKPPVAPLRPGPVKPVLEKDVPDDPTEALMAGIKAAS